MNKVYYGIAVEIIINRVLDKLREFEKYNCNLDVLGLQIDQYSNLYRSEEDGKYRMLSDLFDSSYIRSDRDDIHRQNVFRVGTYISGTILNEVTSKLNTYRIETLFILNTCITNINLEKTDLYRYTNLLKTEIMNRIYEMDSFTRRQTLESLKHIGNSIYNYHINEIAYKENKTGYKSNYTGSSTIGPSCAIEVSFSHISLSGFMPNPEKSLPIMYGNFGYLVNVDKVVNLCTNKYMNMKLTAKELIHRVVSSPNFEENYIDGIADFKSIFIQLSGKDIVRGLLYGKDLTNSVPYISESIQNFLLSVVQNSDNYFKWTLNHETNQWIECTILSNILKTEFGINPNERKIATDLKCIMKFEPGLIEYVDIIDYTRLEETISQMLEEDADNGNCELEIHLGSYIFSRLMAEFVCADKQNAHATLNSYIDKPNDFTVVDVYDIYGKVLPVSFMIPNVIIAEHYDEEVADMDRTLVALLETINLEIAAKLSSAIIAAPHNDSIESIEDYISEIQILTYLITAEE